MAGNTTLNSSGIIFPNGVTQTTVTTPPTTGSVNTNSTYQSVTLPTGLIIKTGYIKISSRTSITYTFPTAFPSTCYSVVATRNEASGTNTGGLVDHVAIRTTTVSASGFSLSVPSTPTGWVSYIAIGI